MGFLLKQSGWQAASYNPSVCGAFILEMDVAGKKLYFATNQIQVREFDGGSLVNCISAILNSPSFNMSIDPYSKEFNVAEIDFQIMAKYFPTAKTIHSGQSFSSIRARVMWMIDGGEFFLDQAFLLMDGLADGFRYSEPEDIVSFRVVDHQISGDRRFPPKIISTTSFTSVSDGGTVPDESFGKCYPVVIGNVYKMPLINISDDFSRFLAMDDPFIQLSGTPVDKVYEEDTELTISTQASATDGELNTYWYVDISGDESTSENVTADIAGPCGNLVQSIQYLLSAFSSKKDMFDMNSLQALSDKFAAVELSTVFNSIVDGGVVQAIKERLIKEFPLIIIQRGAKLYFQHLFWERNIVKTLSHDKNIIQTVSDPTEIERSQMANSFVVTAGVSGLRGDALIAVSRTKDNDAICYLSSQRYGELGKREISVPDVVDSSGATWLMNWVVETYAKKRIRVSYLCSFDVIDVNLWDTIEVFDKYLNWNHGPLFKVVGITYGCTNGVVLDLLSHDDYFDVYGVNKNNPDIDTYPITFTLSGVTI